MPDRTLACQRFRGRIERYLLGRDDAPELQAHWLECDECLEALTEAALRCPAVAPVPAGFAARTLARVPRPEKSVLPYTIPAACLLFAALAAWALQTGSLAEAARWLGDMVARRLVLAGIAALEITGSAVWLWRASRA